MFLCSVFTPYYSETVLYSMDELQKKNEDGISILFYLQKIFPGILSFQGWNWKRNIYLFILSWICTINIISVYFNCFAMYVLTCSVSLVGSACFLYHDLKECWVFVEIGSFWLAPKMFFIVITLFQFPNISD